MNISVTAVLTWTDPNHSPAPAKVYINENSSAIGDIVQGNWCNGTQDNGFGDSSTNIPAPYTGLISQVYSEGSHLFQADGSSGSITQTRMLTGDFTVYNISFSYGKAMLDWQYTAAVDPRSVTIVCHSLEDADLFHTYGGNFHKGNNGLPALNQRNPDGSIIVDAVVDYTGGGSAVLWFKNLELEAVTTGFDTSIYTNIFGYHFNNMRIDWTASGSSASIGDDSPLHATMNASGDEDTTLGSNTDVSVNVQDFRPNLNASAANKYKIVWHNSIENAHESTTINPVFDHVNKYAWSNSIAAGNSTPVSVVATQAKQWALSGDTVGAAISGVCGSGLVALLFTGISAEATAAADIIFNVMGYTISKSGTPEQSTTMSVVGDQSTFNTAITEQQAINSGQGVDCPDDPRIICADTHDFLRIVADPYRWWTTAVTTGRCHKGSSYNRHAVVGDGYDSHGYTTQVTNYPIIYHGEINIVWQWNVNHLNQ